MWKIVEFLSWILGGCVGLCVGLLINGIGTENIYFLLVAGIGYGAGFLLFWSVVIALLMSWNESQEKVRARILVEALKEYKKENQDDNLL